MTEIRALPWNGLRVASTFSGCGGSSLGYRMAGYRVVWCNEFVPAARESYAANADPATIINPADIRELTGADLLAEAGLSLGELDLLDGSPPCAAFSTAGHREGGWGQVRKYSDTAQRVDDLFYEFARLVRDVQPRAFVAENVSGLVKGTAKGYFKAILQTLIGCGYRVEARLLDARWLGVPQSRARLFFVGVRNDLGRGPVFPDPLPYYYSIRDAIMLPDHDLVMQRTGDQFQWERRPNTEPSTTIRTSISNDVIVRCVPWSKQDIVLGDIDDVSPCVTTNGIAAANATDFAIVPGETNRAAGWLGLGVEATAGGGTVDVETGHVLSLGASVPIGRQALKQRAGAADTLPKGVDWTISNPRKFSLRELRRICSFPDDFVLTGSYMQRWERLGRSVPPVMMSHVAATLRDQVLCAG